MKGLSFKTLKEKALRPLAAVLAVSVGLGSFAQHRDAPVATNKGPEIAPSYAWKMISPLGLREPAAIDTSMINYATEFVPSAISPAWVTTGNYGSEGLNMIYPERVQLSSFFFKDALEHWMPLGSKMQFYNTRIPMTLLSFNTGGSRDNSQERLQATFSGNINRKAQIGAMLDYLYSKGNYANQAAKDLSWGFNGSYLGDRYEFQGFYNHFNLLNKENGGITDVGYILDPEELQGGVSTIDPKAIPTKLSGAHTRLWGQELVLNNRYKVGYWHEEPDSLNDTIVHRTYIPVTSFIYTLKYNAGKHLFTDAQSSETSKFFEHTYLNPNFTHDKTTYWEINNTLGVSLLEGFNKYAKFGLAAYVTHQVRRYNMPADTLDLSAPEIGVDARPDGIGIIRSSETQQLAWVGAQLTKQRGAILRYEATAELGFLGPAAGEIKADGSVTTSIPVWNDSLRITGVGHFSNETAPYLMNNYISNHHIWQNDFGKTRRVWFGGDLEFNRTGTHFLARVYNIQNQIYFNESGMPVQHGGNVQVLSLGLLQKIKAGPFNWENKIYYQTTSDDKVIPLPALSLSSNAYFLFRIATLKVQAGINCDYYTRYYAPCYLPSLASFGNQHSTKLGNYPFCNIYINMRLSRARFYVLYSHVNQGLFGGRNYFSTPDYPLNPRRFQLGISVDFAN